MTVIVLSKYAGNYYMHSDGRTSQDWMAIASDNSVKVHKDTDYIYGTCGNASAKVVIKALLKRTRDPFKIIKLLHHKDFRDILQDSCTLVATQRHGCYSISIHKNSGTLFT